MDKREKVAKGLECCTKKVCIYKDTEKECPYSELCGEYEDSFEDCTTALSKDALALLKAQEPRVMMLEEAKSASGYVVVQSHSCNILELQLIKDGFVYDSFVEPIAVDDMWLEGYNKYWRLWTSVPTDAQMEAVKWDG